MISEQSFSLKTLQKIELSILKDIEAFCIKNNIRYYLYCGTLLGCIRHGGFIPWDDDIDLAMPLADYKTFCSLISKDQNFLKKYDIQGTYNSSSSDLWVKIIRKNTVYFERDCMQADIDKGISLDIYPLIGEYENRFMRSVQSKAIAFQHLLHLWDTAKKTDYYYVQQPRTKRLLERLRFVPDFLRPLMVFLIKKTLWPDPGNHKKSGTIDSAPFSGKYEHKICKETTEGVFEGEKFPIPKEYDTILRTMYRDYMTLPPEELRRCHHYGNIYFAYGPDVAEEAGSDI